MAKTMEIVVEHPDGTQMRSNVLGGQCLKVTTGTSPLKVTLNDQNEALVGIPSDIA